MNNSRLKAIEDGQTGIAKKVLAAVPAIEAWTHRQIVMEIARTGSCPDPRIVEGCLRSLGDAGLIKETKTGGWIRVMPKDSPEKEPAAAVVPAATKPAFTLVEPSRPFDRMAALAERMRERAAEFAAMAAEAEELALAFEAEVTRAGADSQRLKQLQELLRGLT
jgi:hypothetical protein